MIWCCKLSIFRKVMRLGWNEKVSCDWVRKRIDWKFSISSPRNAKFSTRRTGITNNFLQTHQILNTSERFIKSNLFKLMVIIKSKNDSWNIACIMVQSRVYNFSFSISHPRDFLENFAKNCFMWYHLNANIFVRGKSRLINLGC